MRAERHHRLWCAWLWALATAGCSGITVDAHPDPKAALGSRDTWAWLEPPAAPDATGSAAADAELAQRLQRAVEEDLTALGWRQVPADGASLLVATELAWEEQQELHDPYYAYSKAERYEEGVLTIRLLERNSKQPLWVATSRCRLRTVARDVGVHSRRYAGDPEPRSWPVEGLVGAILGKLR
jgi:hypothetical protein